MSKYSPRCVASKPATSRCNKRAPSPLKHDEELYVRQVLFRNFECAKFSTSMKIAQNFHESREIFNNARTRLPTELKFKN